MIQKKAEPFNLSGPEVSPNTAPRNKCKQFTPIERELQHLILLGFPIGDFQDQVIRAKALICIERTETLFLCLLLINRNN